MASEFSAVFVILVSVLLSSHGLHDILETYSNKDSVRDKATVSFINKLNIGELTILAKSQECWNCTMTEESKIKSQHNVSLNFSTNFPSYVRIMKGKSSICNLSLELQEKNEYVVYLNGLPCNATLLSLGLPDPNRAVYWLVGFLFVIVCTWEICHVLKKKGTILKLRNFKSKILKRTRILFIKNSDDSDVGSQGSSTTDLIQADLGDPINNVKKYRNYSVDAFRGFSLVLMIFVNYGGGGYWYFQHAIWDGLTVADLVFPWFVFVMGLTIGITFQSCKKKKSRKLEIFMKILRRSACLFLLGLVLSNKQRTLTNLRIPGVLQRLAITYLVVATIETFEISFIPKYANKLCSQLRDILPFWRSWIIVFVCILIHLCLTFFLPVPGCPSGYLGAGGLQDLGKFENCTGGAAGYIDRMVFGQEHIYQHPTCMKLYQTKVPFDPEGILGTLTSIVLCYFGVQAGRILLAYETFGKITRWFIWAIILSIAGGTLCGFKKFGGFIPLNKNLWSLSFVFLLSGTAFIMLIIFHLLIDCLAIWSGVPFIYLGMNSIAVYLCSEVFEDYFPLHLFSPDSHTGLTAMHAWGVLVWIIVSAVMHSNNIFIAI